MKTSLKRRRDRVGVVWFVVVVFIFFFHLRDLGVVWEGL